jgi:hypothetical protein
MGRGIVLGLLLAAALSACGDATSGTPAVPAASPTAALPADGPVRTVTTVLDDGDGPVMCLGGMADSLPPQCDGPDVAGWDWGDHPEAESADGARWGEFVLVGDWDGTTLTPSEARVAGPDDGPSLEDYSFITSCEEPEGGWEVVDPATTNNAAKGAAQRVAEALPDYGLVWGDQSINPYWQELEDLQDSGGMPSLEAQQAMNDPALTILNVGVTDDLARAEAAVREVWGGPLCVYRLANTFERLREVATELQDLPGNLGPQFGTVSNRVELPVVHDDGSIQAWVDEAYGAGVVEVTSALTPVG